MGNSEKAKRILGWKPEIELKDLVSEMMAYDLNLLKDN